MLVFFFVFFLMCVFLCVASTVSAVCFDAVVGFYLENRENPQKDAAGREEATAAVGRRDYTHACKHTHTRINTLRDWRLEICRSHTPSKKHADTLDGRVCALAPGFFLQLYVLPL